MKQEIIERLREIRERKVEHLTINDILFIVKCKKVKDNVINSFVDNIIDIFTYNLFNKTDFFDDISFIELVLARLKDNKLYNNVKKYYKDNIDNIVNDIINI